MQFSALIPKASMFTLAIHLLFNHFWFTFIHGPNIPGSYAILVFIALDFTSITSHIHTWALLLLLLHLFILFHSSPVAYWAPTNLGSSSFSVLSFCLFILFIGFSRQEYWSGLPLPSPVDHVLSELSTMTRPSWLVLHGMAHSFTELDKAVVHVIIWLVFCVCGFHSVCLLRDKDKRLMEALWWERLTVGETGSCSDGQGHAPVPVPVPVQSLSHVQLFVTPWITAH